MALAVLSGQGTYGPSVPWGNGISPLWQYMRMPPAQNSILIYDDGTVVEGAHLENDAIKGADVYLYIYGGTRFTCEVGSFEYDALVAAGYTLTELPEPDSYTDDYQDVY